MGLFSEEYVLVSQGIEIYRTTNKEEAEYIMNTGNDEYYTYLKNVSKMVSLMQIMKYLCLMKHLWVDL